MFQLHSFGGGIRLSVVSSVPASSIYRQISDIPPILANDCRTFRPADFEISAEDQLLKDLEEALSGGANSARAPAKFRRRSIEKFRRQMPPAATNSPVRLRRLKRRRIWPTDPPAASAKFSMKLGPRLRAEFILRRRKKSVNSRSRAKSDSNLETDNSGFPLAIFTKGSILHPYLSLAYIDLLKSDRVRSYVFGATNALFKQRRNFFDAIVWEDDESGGSGGTGGFGGTGGGSGSKVMKIDICDADLRRQLQLTAADLRFCEFLMKTVCPEGAEEKFGVEKSNHFQIWDQLGRRRRMDPIAISGVFDFVAGDGKSRGRWGSGRF